MIIALDEAVWRDGTTRLPDHKIYCGRVRYMATPDLRREVDAFAGKPGGREISPLSAPALLAKRDAFQFENEVRTALMMPSGRRSLATDALKKLIAVAKSKRISRAVEQILLDPYLPAWQANEQCTAWKLLTRRLGLRCAVRQSRFDASP
jgi:hypothetical protein